MAKHERAAVNREDLSVGKHYMWRREDDADKSVGEEVELISMDAKLRDGQWYEPPEPLTARPDPDFVRVQIVGTGEEDDARVAELAPVSEPDAS